ncbi:hypothetical protein ABW21_db0200424 [Orbilia brochopaga]|nr:hypothetical protein ABW21_db0200424 [Drechslerella brochopaga]
MKLEPSSESAPPTTPSSALVSIFLLAQPFSGRQKSFLKLRGTLSTGMHILFRPLAQISRLAHRCIRAPPRSRSLAHSRRNGQVRCEVGRADGDSGSKNSLIML